MFKKLFLKFCAWYLNNDDLWKITHPIRYKRTEEAEAQLKANAEMKQFLSEAQLDNLYGGIEKDLDIINLSKSDISVKTQKPLEDLRRGEQTTVGYN